MSITPSQGLTGYAREQRVKHLLLKMLPWPCIASRLMSMVIMVSETASFQPQVRERLEHLIVMNPLSLEKKTKTTK